MHAMTTSNMVQIINTSNPKSSSNQIFSEVASKLSIEPYFNETKLSPIVQCIKLDATYNFYADRCTST